VGAAAAAPTSLPRHAVLVSHHTSYRTTAYLDSARRLALDILLVSEGAHAPVGPTSSGLHVDFTRPEAAADTIRRACESFGPVSAVIGTDDGAVELAALAARALGLPHNPAGAARLARRKDLARECLGRSGVSIPDFAVISRDSTADARRSPLGYPCVIKPVALSGSRGVIRADDDTQYAAAVRRILRILDSEGIAGEESARLLVERFIPGVEVALEGMLDAGCLETLALFDKPDPLDGPFFEETLYVSPSRLTPGRQEQVRVEVERACAAYGLVQGPVHAECRLNGDRVVILEVAARTIGGMCARLFELGSGASLEEVVLARACGVPCPGFDDTSAAGVLMLPIAEHGILRRVEGVMAARAEPFVEDVVIVVREGYELVPLPEGGSYLGFVYARAPGPGQVEAALRAAGSRLRVVVAPLWPAVVG